MDTMFDKLGDLLSQCLKTGEFPEPKTNEKTNKKKDFIPSSLIKEFSILGFNQSSSQEHSNLIPLPDFSEIRITYKKLLKEIHPDTTKETILDNKNISEKIEQITDAYSKIKEWYESNKIESV